MASDDGNMACCGQRNASDGDMLIAMAKPKADDDAFISPPLRLTRKNLARLNTLNGDAKHSDNDNDSAYLFEDDSHTMTTSTTASDFERQAYENGILDPVASHPPPQDLGTIRHHLTQRRTSTQPSEHAHQRYCKGISKSYNEAGVSSSVQSKIMKDYSESDGNYGRAYSRAITRIPSQDFNYGLSNPLPDILEGLDTEVCQMACTITMLSTPKTRCLSVTSLPNLSAPMAISTRQHTRLRTTVLRWSTHGTGHLLRLLPLVVITEMPWSKLSQRQLSLPALPMVKLPRYFPTAS